MNLIDNYKRKHDYLRISLTDKCNFNCIYCNPNSHVNSNGKKDHFLTFEEIERIVRLFSGKLGFKKVRFTGGEPLVRKDVFELFENIGRVLSRARLEEGLYSIDEDMASNAVEVHIHHLRKKLGSQLIRTIRGVGYTIDKLSDDCSNK